MTSPKAVANIKEFDTKLKQFEKQQEEENLHLIKQKTNSRPNNNDKVSNYPGKSESILKCTIISNLIERGLKLKNEMSKSTSNLALNEHYYTDDFTFLNEATNDTSFGNISSANFNDISRLSDPLHDPSMLSALIYQRMANEDNETSKYDTSVCEDAELRELLAPSNLSLLSSHHDQPIKLTSNNQNLPKQSKTLCSKSLSPFSRNRSISRSSLSSNFSDDDNDTTQSTRFNNSNRVSFEIQSSDGEHSTLNPNEQLHCMDILSPQRISLLNLVQISKLSINKLCFFATWSLNSLLLDRKQQTPISKSITTTSTNSKSKPPLASKQKPEFFIEYQFPVVAASSSREPPAHLMATQVMRVNAKRVRVAVEDTVQFEHEADYAVLFNSSSLETWWRSAIVFKIYCRLSAVSTTTTCLTNSTNQPPSLIGQARLSLRNALKSRNFKLYKKLAVLDQHDGNGRRRIGTLHVSIELTSDMKEFKVGLVKLKNAENKQTTCISRSPSIPATQQHQQHQQLYSHSMPLISSCKTVVNNIEKQTELPTMNEAFNLPIQMYMSISEGRGFVLAPTDSATEPTASIYLVCRLFWCRETVRFETATNKSNTQFCWTLNLSFLLRPSVIKKMRNNFMVIEAWQKMPSPSGMKSAAALTDVLIGMIKLPLHEFYLRFEGLLNCGLKEFLHDPSAQPVVGVDGWCTSLDPFTGRKSGEINALLAMGSSDQILNLQKYMFDKARIKFNAIAATTQQDGGVAVKPAFVEKPKKSMEHMFTFNIDAIKVHPVRTNSGNEFVLDETDYYVKYMFPSLNCVTGSYAFKSYAASTRLNTHFSCKQEHRFVLELSQSIQTELADLLQKQGSAKKVNFEVWSKSYFPNLREKLVGVGELALDRLLTVVDNASHSDGDGLCFNNKTFIVPLVQVDGDDDKVTSLMSSDKYCGQLFVTIDYKFEEFVITGNNKYVNLVGDQAEEINVNNNSVCLSVGVLRANGLKSAIRNAVAKNNSNCESSAKSFFNFEESKVFVKFGLGFLNQHKVNSFMLKQHFKCA